MVFRLGKRMLVVLNIIAALLLLLSYFSASESPEKHLWIAYFGLGYPIWLTLNFLFFILWAIRRDKWILISLFSIVFGYSHFLHYFNPIPEKKPNVKGTNFSVMTYNVRLFDWYNWKHNKETRNKIFDMLKKEDPDILCFQEFYLNKPAKTFTTRDTLVKFMKARYVHDFYPMVIKNEQFYGMATFSRYPIVKKGNIRFGNDRGNSCIFTDLKIGEDTIRVFNVHLASIRFEPEDYHFIEEVSEETKDKVNLADAQGIVTRLGKAFLRRTRQINDVMSYVEKSPYPVLLCGDFNDTPVSYTYQQVSSVLKDSFHERGFGVGHTYVGKFPSFRIDYIFHDNHFSVGDVHRDKEKLSDHLPVIAKMTLLKPSSSPGANPAN